MTQDNFDLEPLGTNLVVRRASMELTSEAGIIMPDSVAAKKLNEGVVMAVGKGGRDSYGERIPMDVEVGDEILWGDYTGNDIVRGDDTYCILGESDILVILRG